MNVLVTTPSWQSALACIQSLGQAGHTVFLAGRHTRNPNERSCFIKRHFEWNTAAIDEAVLQLIRIVDENDIDVVIPISDIDALITAKANSLHGRGCYVVGSENSVNTARSRNKTADLCKRIEIPIPRSVAVTKWNALTKARETGYPCFLKLSNTVGSEGVFRLRSDEELQGRLASIPDFVEIQLQEQITGVFVGMTGFARSGQLIDSFSFENDYKHSHGGNPPYAQEVFDPALHGMLALIVRELDWTGGIDLDLLRDAEGRYYLLEVNPRLSGTAVFPLKCGVDLPSHYIDAVQGLPPKALERKSPEIPRRFVSLIEEALYLRRAGIPARQFAREFRRGDGWLDNSFWNDETYSKALFEVVHELLLS